MRMLPDWETRDDGGAADVAPEIRAALAELTGSVNGRFDALGKRLDTIEARANRPGADKKDDGKADERRAAFLEYCRHGVEGMTPETRAALIVGDDTKAGYLAPDQFVTELDRNLVFFSPVRSAARVSGMSAGAISMPKRTGTLTGRWVGETQERSQTNPTYGLDRYEAHEMACYVDVSTAALEDSAFDIAGELAIDLSEEFGRLESVAFVNGDGKLKPAGFMADANIGNTVSGHASQITADGLIDLYHALKPPYRMNAVWMLNSTTLATVRKLKGTDGHYLLQSTPINGMPANTILGRPVVEAPDMPDVAAGAFPVAFGDFSLGYRVFDRTALQVLRDPYSVATEGLTRFHARRRVAGGVRRAEAIRKLRIAAS